MTIRKMLWQSHCGRRNKICKRFCQLIFQSLSRFNKPIPNQKDVVYYPRPSVSWDAVVLYVLRIALPTYLWRLWKATPSSYSNFCKAFYQLSQYFVFSNDLADKLFHLRSPKTFSMCVSWQRCCKNDKTLKKMKFFGGGKRPFRQVKTVAPMWLSPRPWANDETLLWKLFRFLIFPQMFLRLPSQGNVVEANCFPGSIKCYSTNWFRNILIVSSTMNIFFLWISGKYFLSSFWREKLLYFHRTGVAKRHLYVKVI